MLTLVLVSCNKEETPEDPVEKDTAELTVNTSVEDLGTIEGVTVRLMDQEDHELVSLLTDATGGCTFTDILPGYYHVECYYHDGEEGYSAYDNEIFVLNKGDEKTVSYVLD